MPNIVPDFGGLRVAVVGDVVADHYLFTEPVRLSREAPVLVLEHRSERLRPGGAGNVAVNLFELGAACRVATIVGKDAEGLACLRALEEERIDVSAAAALSGWTTPRKTRVLSAESHRPAQQVLRLDRAPDGPPPADARAALAERVARLAGRIDVLMVSDYAYGVVGAELAPAIAEVAAEGALVVLDPRARFDLFPGLTAMTPNLGELATASDVAPEDLAAPGALRDAGRALLERAGLTWLLVTLGNRGMALVGRGDEFWTVPASGSDEVVDVTGAGDTAAATFTLALAAGLDGPSAMRLANAASGVVVLERGTATCSASRLRVALPRAPEPVGDAGALAP